jgi:YD repeat-containing protein
MVAYVAENIADPTIDQVRFTVFNLFNKPDYVVKTTLGINSSVKQYFYDEVGNLLSICRYQNTLTFTDYADLQQKLLALEPDSSTDRITHQKFDTVNRITEATDSLGFKDIYTHDALDNLITHTDRAGFLWQNSYDRARRLTSVLTPTGPVGVVIQSGKE